MLGAAGTEERCPSLAGSPARQPVFLTPLRGKALFPRREAPAPGHFSPGLRTDSYGMTKSVARCLEKLSVMGGPARPDNPVMATEPPNEHVRRAARTYCAAADHYRRPALGFWDRFGAATVSRLRLAPGAAVLDLCCGAGASALSAARAVGPEGRVLGIDIAAPMLELARARAAAEGLANIEFRPGDATRAGLPDGGFDAVICVFGVFFAPDMAAFVREMWLFSRAGVTDPVVVAAPGQHRLDHPDRFWDVVLGSGYRATVDALSPEQRDRVRESLLAELQSREISSLRTDVVFGTAARPG